MEGSTDLFEGEDYKSRTMSVDLQTDSSLQVEISDAVSERDKVKFTVHTKTNLTHFKQPEFSVVRQHEEFIWLHDAYLENEDYAGIIYLAIFKKTVAMHEVFLQRLAAHPQLRGDHNFYVFLEYDQELSVRGKNRKEILGGFLKSIVKTADEAIITGISGMKEVDEFFEHERTFLIEYHNRVKDATLKADRKTRSHKNVAEDYIPISSALSGLGTLDTNPLSKVSAFRKNMIEMTELELKHAKANLLLLRNCLSSLRGEQ
ncbi:hypothetical protein chiPu_0020839 [Chiloscyllium punctatum]|uniref:PX domain-containing protein n=1 Tax=Chiloscyllium punctatum TaxID=137246 RepID=A0A401RKB9_CHIPU|nr:hypothetical protein [Chiloscyllium punctatum]